VTTQIDSEKHSFIERPSRDELGIRLAVIYSTRGTCERAQVGAVISREGRAIASGYVGAPAGLPHCTDVGCDIGDAGGCIRTVHAEANAIAYAARSGTSTEGATIYSTHAPCLDCAKLIINAGLTRFVYDFIYRDPRGLQLLRDAGVEVEQYPTPGY
jgi:dCMP deaminase